MASKTFTANTGSNNVYWLRLTLSSKTNVAGNYSDVSYTFQFGTDNQYAQYNFSYGNKAYLAINGTVLLNTANVGRIAFSGAGVYTLASGSIRVPHNSDGKKTISVTGTFTQTQNTTWNATVSGNMPLDTIPRTSMSTVSPTSCAVGSKITITTHRASTAFTHTITYAIGSAKGTIATGVTDSVSWTVPKDLAKQFPNATSKELILTCTTYSGNTKIGECLMGVNVGITSDMVPSFTFATAAANSLPDGIAGYVKGKSKVKVTISASGSYGSTIKKYSIKVNGATYNSASATSEYLTTAGNNTITMSVTDSRGKTATKTTTISVTDYTGPSAGSVQAYRCVSATDSTASDTGEFICVKITGKITALGSKNQKTCAVYYKTSAATSWSSKAVTLSAYSFTVSAIFAADGNSSFNVRVALGDSFSTSDYYATVSSAFTLANIRSNGRGIAWGKVSEGDEFDVGMPAVFRGTARMEGVVSPKRGILFAQSSAGGGQSGYLKMARITIQSGATYTNTPITFFISRRHDAMPGIVTVTFENANSADPGLSSFSYFGQDVGAYLKKASAGVWDLYIKKAESYDSIAITHQLMNYSYMSKVEITYPGEFAGSVSGGTAATPCELPSSGLLFRDSDGKEYYGIADNGSNLWIGAWNTDSYHHKGNTIISAGDETAVFVSKKNGGTRSNYALLDADNYNTEYIQTGLTEAVSVSAGGITTKDVTFHKAFPSKPRVIACIYSGSTNVNMGYLTMSVHNISQSGFTARFYNRHTGGFNPQVMWIAMIEG